MRSAECGIKNLKRGAWSEKNIVSAANKYRERSGQTS